MNKSKIFGWSFVCLVLLISFVSKSYGAVYLDNLKDCPTCTDGNQTYNPSTRSCGKGNDTVYVKLETFNQKIVPGETNYIRSGIYTRNSNSTFVGSLSIDKKSGTPQNYTVVSAYPGEELKVTIGTDPNKLHYNPNPGDTSFTLSSKYYPCPAVSISNSSYLRLSGIKTFGQVFVHDYNDQNFDTHDVIVENCDFGGGGPSENQGQVVKLHTVYDVFIRNNLIHHSSWGESDANGSALMGYNFSAVIENNEFYDNWNADVRLKDTGYQQGRSIIIRNNFFAPSAIYKDKGVGVMGIAQDRNVDKVIMHNNIFYKKNAAIEWDGSGTILSIARNNTFIDCNTDISSWQDSPINLSNNLYYHSPPGQIFYDVQANPYPRLDSNHNLFYSANSDTKWRNLYKTIGTSLSTFQALGSWDMSSVEKFPGFEDPLGNRPEDFRRKSYAGDVKNSPYGAVCGAYVTGQEIVGRGSAVAPQNPPVPESPPAPQVQPPHYPENLRIILESH